MRILSEDERKFEAWGSVEVRDADNEIIPIDELEKVMDKIMERGGVLIDQHSNRPVGKILNWRPAKHKKSGKDGVVLTCKIFKDYELDDEIWEGIKSGKKKGLSFGGRSKKQKIDFTMEEGEKKPVKVLEDIEGYEFSVVDDPANPLATFTDINFLAKSKIKKYIRRSGNKWEVVSHKTGKVLGTHDTKEDAVRHLQAIQAHKFIKNYLEGEYKMDTLKSPDGRPPKQWWDRCISRAKDFADDPAKFCGALYHDPERFPHGAGSKLRESFGKGENIDEKLLEKAVNYLTKESEKSHSGKMVKRIKKQEEEEQEEEEETPTEEEEKQEEGSSEERLSKLEAQVAEILQLLKPAEETVEETKETVAGEQEGTDLTSEVVPEPEGVEVTLPKVPAETIQEEQPDTETDESAVDITAGIKDLIDKRFREIKKELGVTTTPRPKINVRKSMFKKQKTPVNAYALLNKARKSKKPSVLSWDAIREMEQEQRRQEVSRILGG